ncbi:FG-GAP-like repeat-containing protein [Candidatus Binatus sp.]|uniref:FG-GAP-like repeat-containing protein n=1 Tax=Candidatus Binatus sp. TaxID=2811406 RepID=UPI003C4C6D05
MKHKSLTATMVLLAVGIALSVWADPTALTTSNGSVTVTSNSASTLDFPISRSGDTSYDAFVQYQTQDGTALAGIDYTAASGSIVIPAGTTSFATQQTFATGSVPYSVTAADVNGDGKPDLIVANALRNTVSVLLNTTARGAAKPSFSPPQTFTVGSVPYSVTAADINGNGKPDLIVANALDNTVSVLLNSTAPGAIAPSFSPQQTFATGSVPYSVTTADIDGNGKLDLIVTNNDAGVSVLINTTAPGATTPSFATRQTFATGSFAFSATVADVNGNNKPDLIVANYNSNTVSVLLNTTVRGATTPSFAPQQTFAAGSCPHSVTSADINGDGKPDLILANAGSEGRNGVSVLLNTTAPGATTPSFAPQQTFTAFSDPTSVTAADVNGDGKPDLIVANEAGAVSVLLNTTAPGAATPSFGPQQDFAAGGGPISVTAADINGDGKPDLIVANGNDTTVSVLLNAMYATTLSGSPAAGTIHYGVLP